MITVELSDRQAHLIAALVDHHVAEITSGFIEGTVTWTTQLNVDPRLAGDVVDTVLAWVKDANTVKANIRAAAKAAGVNLDDVASSSRQQRGTDHDRPD